MIEARSYLGIMRKDLSLILFFAVAAAAIAALDSAFCAEPLRLLQAVSLEGVEGRFDHFAVDVTGERLFVAALGNNTVEVIDLRGGKRIQTLRGMQKPAGLLWVGDRNRLYVASGGNGSLDIFHGSSFELIKSIKDVDDADNLRYDTKTHLVYLGYGNGALTVIEPTQESRVAELKLKGHPESFQLQSEGKRIYVNVPDAKQLAVLDRVRREQIAAIPMDDFRGNFPMALDEGSQRLFIGCRQPAHLVVLDSNTLKRVADVPIADDTDDLFYDTKRKRVLVSCGAGFIDVIEQTSADKYAEVARIPTSAGARTSLFSPELNRYFVAVPHHEQQKAEIRIYEPK